jgi:hypothetical protein
VRQATRIYLGRYGKKESVKQTKDAKKKRDPDELNPRSTYLIVTANLSRNARRR